MCTFQLSTHARKLTKRLNEQAKHLLSFHFRIHRPNHKGSTTLVNEYLDTSETPCEAVNGGLTELALKFCAVVGPVRSQRPRENLLMFALDRATGDGSIARNRLTLPSKFHPVDKSQQNRLGAGNRLRA